MSEHFDQFLTGTLLGDSFVQKDGRFGFNHSAKQRDYFDHKVSVLTEAGIKVWLGENTVTSNIGGRHIIPTIMLQARTTRRDQWKGLRKKFYPADTKIIPNDLKLTPLVLAYWYMDDGTANMRSRYVSTHKGKRYEYNGKPFIQQFRLYTDGFDTTDTDLLISKLKDDLNIEAWLHTRKGTNHKYIIISRLEAREKFQELLLPIIKNIPSMLYKIDHKLNFQCERLSEKAPLEGRCDSPALKK